MRFGPVLNASFLETVKTNIKYVGILHKFITIGRKINAHHARNILVTMSDDGWD